MATTTHANEKKEIPHGVWTKCKKCEQIIFKKELDNNLKICPKCGYYFRLGAYERIKMLTEPQSFEEYYEDLLPVDPLKFPDYAKRVKASHIKEAAVAGKGKIGKHEVMMVVLDFGFMGGSMGSVVGEKIARSAEAAIKAKIPFIIVAASGGARMQEGILSLMQMAKTSAALAKLANENLPYICILTDPTTGGVTASFAMLGDVHIAEPGALIGFAGPRVIEQTIRQQLPEGFQLSEFLKQHGMVDIIAERKELKNILIKVLNFMR
jgi:acetyl-CoA carboxylase carboxyl transferase subunit beta